MRLPLPVIGCLAILGAASAASAEVSTQLNCDAVTVASRLPRPVMQDLEPAHSLDAVVDVLKRHDIAFDRGRGVVTVSNAPRALIDRISTLPQGEPFVFPNGPGMVICVLAPSPDSI
jgi:hypothetical protein